MIHIPLNIVTLAEGIKYPAPVAKACQSQHQAEAAFTAALVKLSEAEHAHETAIGKDRAAMEDAARNSTGAPTTSHAAKADREREYADTVATQARDALVNASRALEVAIGAHAGEILPDAIKLARDACESYDTQMTAIRAQAAAASRVVGNAAHGLNLLRKHLPYAQFQINFVAPTLTLPPAAASGNLLQVADRLERAADEHNNPRTMERWPVSHAEQLSAASA